MSNSFGQMRAITVSGFSADADPNVTPPDPSTIFKLTGRNSLGQDSAGHLLVGKYNDSQPTGTATYTTWFRDSVGGDWYQFTSDTLTHRVGKVTTSLRFGDIFVQVKALANVGDAATFTVAISEL